MQVVAEAVQQRRTARDRDEAIAIIRERRVSQLFSLERAQVELHIAAEVSLCKHAQAGLDVMLGAEPAKECEAGPLVGRQRHIHNL